MCSNNNNNNYNNGNNNKIKQTKTLWLPECRKAVGPELMQEAQTKGKGVQQMDRELFEKLNKEAFVSGVCVHAHMRT